MRVKFALKSPLIQLFADCIEWDEKKIRDRILEHNKLNYNYERINTVS